MTEKVEKLSTKLSKKLTEKGEDERGGGSESEGELGGSTLWDRLQRRLEAQRGVAGCEGEGGGMGRDRSVALKSLKVPSLKCHAVKGRVEATGEIMVATREEGGSRKKEEEEEAVLQEEEDGEEEDLFAPRGADLARKNTGRAGGGRGKDGDEVEEVFGRTGERNDERLAGRRGGGVLKGMEGENEGARARGGEGGCQEVRVGRGFVRARLRVRDE